jgi:DNA end-binding protein Ku
VAARAIWQGNLIVQKHDIPVKIFSAVVDRQIHFHLLHKRDHMRVQQRMVDAEAEEPIPLDEARKGFEVEPGLFVEVTPEEMERFVPEASRDIRIKHFVPRNGIDPQMYERPYYLGPGEHSEASYFALAEALASEGRAGIAFWVMRKHSYAGALLSQDGYLSLITLRNDDQVIPVGSLDPPQGRPLAANEKQMAEKLIEALSGEFRPEEYRDLYQQRIQELIDAKRFGRKLKPKRAPRKRQAGSLAETLRASLKQVEQDDCAR